MFVHCLSRDIVDRAAQGCGFAFDHCVIKPPFDLLRIPFTSTLRVGGDLLLRLAAKESPNKPSKGAAHSHEQRACAAFSSSSMGWFFFELIQYSCSRGVKLVRCGRTSVGFPHCSIKRQEFLFGGSAAGDVVPGRRCAVRSSFNLGVD